jgi:hypothetical protein
MTRRQRPTAPERLIAPGQPITVAELRGVLADPGLSFAAKGVLALVLSRPPRAAVSIGELFASCADPMEVVDQALDELVRADLLARTRPGRAAAGSTAGGVVFGRGRRARRKGGG